MGAQLGEGGAGQVRAALWNGNDCAVKTFKADSLADFHRELNILHRLRHPNVVGFFGGISAQNQKYRIVMERCKCDVAMQLKKYGSLSAKDGSAKLNLSTRVRYALDAAKAMVFLHQRQIIHHDLKSSNLLIANDVAKTVKICDFSLSNLAAHSFTTGPPIDTLEGSSVGTPGFIAPEEMKGQVVTRKADTFSFGMILYELLHSTLPFADLLFQKDINRTVQKMRMMEVLEKQLRPTVRARQILAR